MDRSSALSLGTGRRVAGSWLHRWWGNTGHVADSSLVESFLLTGVTVTPQFRSMSPRSEFGAGVSCAQPVESTLSPSFSICYEGSRRLLFCLMHDNFRDQVGPSAMISGGVILAGYVSGSASLQGTILGQDNRPKNMFLSDYFWLSK